MRPSANFRAVAVLAASAVALPAAAQATRKAVQSSMTVGAILTIADSGRLVQSSKSATRVTASSSPVVRANAPWVMTVTLVPPVQSDLKVTVSAAGGQSLKLDATTLSGTLTNPAAACDRCAVALSWMFDGSKQNGVTVPAFRYAVVAAPAGAKIK
jgi:hypothetical protein